MTVFLRHPVTPCTCVHHIIIYQIWQENSDTTQDSFQLDTQDVVAGAAGINAAGAATACPLAFVTIPDASPNGVSPLPIPPTTIEFQQAFCGAVLGLDGSAQSLAFVCKGRVHLILYTNLTDKSIYEVGGVHRVHCA